MPKMSLKKYNRGGLIPTTVRIPSTVATDDVIEILNEKMETASIVGGINRPTEPNANCPKINQGFSTGFSFGFCRPVS